MVVARYLSLPIYLLLGIGLNVVVTFAWEVSPSARKTIDRRKSPALWRLLEYEEHKDEDINNSKMKPSAVAQQRPPQVMAPAGGMEQLRAAVANGADAVYVGLSSFSARARATNFDATQLQQAVAYAHAHKVHVYVALNTLVFDTEWDELMHWIQVCVDAQVDAVIVQDLGMCRMIQRMTTIPISAHQSTVLLPIHSSTQQTVTTADGVAFCAERHGATRVVLGRELSTVEIQHVTAAAQQSTTAAAEIEVFVHGALCVSYSGQCFSSEAWGGRSANRGQCAQACRLPYGLLVDGQLRNNNKNNNNQEDLRYLLSPQDLCGLDHVPALTRAGVACLKIEGRLKDATYVAATTRAYRQAVDAAWEALQQEQIEQQRRQQTSSYTNAQSDISPPSARDNNNSNNLQEQRVTRQDLVQLFARGQDEHYDGLTDGFLAGTQHQVVVRGRSPRHRGVHIGRVVANPNKIGSLLVQLDDQYNNHIDDEDHDENDNVNSGALPLKRGDGIVVDRGQAQQTELGGTLYHVEQVMDGGKQRILRLEFGRETNKVWQQHEVEGDVLAPPGAHVWRTHDTQIAKKFRKLATAKPTAKTSLNSNAATETASSHSVTVRVQGELGAPIQIVISDSNDSSPNRIVVTTGTLPLQAAQGEGLSISQIRKAVGTLGNTNLTLIGDVQVDESFQHGLWCPVSQIKETRRLAVEQWEAKFGTSITNNADGNIGMETTNAADEHGKNTRSSTTGQFKLNDVTPESLLQELLANTGVANGHRAQSEISSGPRLSILCRSYEQVDAICQSVESRINSKSVSEDKVTSIVSEIIIDFLELDGMREAMERIRQIPAHAEVRAVVASPRILKPGEGGIWRSLLALRPDALLVRSTGLIHRMQTLGGQGALVDVGTAQEEDWVTIPELLGDFSLNVANALTAAELLQSGLSRVTASYDLNARSILHMAELLKQHDASSRLEVVIHCHMPIFHTEHCVFARFLTKGNSYVDCGHACTRHQVHLRDELTGLDNLVLADMGCRNTVFNAQAQTGVHSIKEWNRAGIRQFRIELVDEDADNTRLVLDTYSNVILGHMKPSQAWEALEFIRDSNGRAAGVSLGSFRNTQERRAGEL